MSTILYPLRRRIVLLLLLSAAPLASGQYQLIDLGPNVEPEAISDTRIVVGARLTDQFPSVAFRYTPELGISDLPLGQVAYDVNAAGLIVGATLDQGFAIDPAGNVVHWTDYRAFGLNENGDLCGNVALPNPHRPTPKPHAPAVRRDDVWAYLDIARTYPRGTRDGIYADLFILNDINEAGYAVGVKSRTGLFGSSSFLIRPAFSEVTYLPISNGGRANAINDANLVVGTTGNNSSTGDFAHAWLYDGSETTDLGTLADGLMSFGNDINNAGQVVGSAWLETTLTSTYDPTSYHAFLWENGVMTDLNLIADAGDSWLLTSAVAINSGGDIAGLGLLNGEPHGFILLAEQIPVDSDGDGVVDAEDNCTLAANADQRDTDADGFGNLCDPDLNNDGVVNIADLGLLRLVFFSADEHADFNGDGVVNAIDLGLMRTLFFAPPGPSGVIQQEAP